ncbi:ABC transporter substrate-binding protein [Pantoea sp. Mb-10]|uniref:ABC transporter substrate-binding protein n=1 Tax=unclassified Pantoea TaxID=2630326 RepID=UPI001E51B622|nr:MULTISPECIES: ABC transporter substrate-binding protein [unclassified Pantoea]MCE0490898.1 ABC transporter substrate-binding protein [Pantoea sp. Mb-10]MCE0499944.1 ABC transporter substrate-binding protein [Pantoea sp. Pb-8]
MEKINIAIDVFPYKENIWSICDYGGEQIYSKLALPLFITEKGTVKPFAAEVFEQSTNEVKIEIKRNLFWSNGDNVKAEDYVRAIRYVISDGSNRYKKILSALIKDEKAIVAHDDYCFSLRTSWYDPFITQHLTLINFSPMHVSNREIYAGPYILQSKNENVIKLIANKKFSLTNESEFVKEIDYVLVAEDLDGQAFFSGIVDVSSNTALDLNKYQQFKSRKEFFSDNDNLVMLLSPGNKFDQIPDDVKMRFVSAIQREAIAAKFNNALEPFYSWMALYYDGEYEVAENNASLHINSFSLDVSYEDFYPNKDVLGFIKSQVAEHNIHLNLCQDNYGDWQSDCHLRFEIRKAPQSSPINIIRSDLSRLDKNHEDYLYLKKLYSCLHVKELSSQQGKIFKKIDAVLRKHGLCIPLFLFPTGFFCVSNLAEASIFSPGKRVQVKKDDENKVECIRT